MTGIRERCGGMSLWNRHCELRAMDLAAVHCHVDGNFLLTNNVDFDLRTGFSGVVWAGTENSGFLESKFVAS